MDKLLVISGPTATGKTALAVEIARKFNGELISADSRQIYQEMNIGTGKDHPSNIKIHLIDVINPSQTYSVALYRQQALSIIKKIQYHHKLPILVGGSGLYIDSVTNSKYNTFSIQPNLCLRFILNFLPLVILQNILRVFDNSTYSSLNRSDVNNPRRLIRKIELALSFPNKKNENSKIENYLHISLTAPNSFLFPRINQRIQTRLDMGLLNEIKSLILNYGLNCPGLKCIAYQELIPYLKNKTPLETCLFHWRRHEYEYARRQKTWFKKINGVQFIDISQPKNKLEAIKLITRWYNKS